MLLYKREKNVFLFIVFINNDYFRLSTQLMDEAINRIWALFREGRLLHFLDYQGPLIRERRLKGAGRLFESFRYVYAF